MKKPKPSLSKTPGQVASTSDKAKGMNSHLPEPVNQPIPDWSLEEFIEPLLTPEQVCRLLKCGDTTLRELRTDELLMPKMVRSLPRYRPRDVRNYMNSK